jgi:4-diphosphocytidyl-2-C-methyl-D-erythritol kinase
MKVLTPAKINLTLEIVGPRPDGFHDLATWMLPIGLADSLEMEIATGPTFSSNISELGPDSSNLIIRAVEAFGEAAGIQADYRICLDKNIPIGAGLGGGSSNAAGTLGILNRLHGNPLGQNRLYELAATLGSDVAFFVNPQSAWCTGRGEKLEPRNFPDDLWIFLAKPSFGVSTAGAYRDYALLPAGKKKGIEEKTAWGILRNDLEASVFPKYVLLPVLKDWLRRQPESLFALMSGSGSTMFSIIRSPGEGESLGDRFRHYFGPKIWMGAFQLNPPLAPGVN